MQTPDLARPAPRPRWTVALALLALLAAAAPISSPAATSSGAQLASDQGCYNCHGDPPKKKAPTFAALAKDYAQYQGHPEQEAALAEKLRTGSFFGHIDAHERLSADTALALVRWIIRGSPPP